MSTTEQIGGWTEWMEVTDEVKEICELVKHEAEKTVHMKFPVYVPLNYRTLIGVLGATHYVIKVYVGNDSCLVMKVVQVLAPDAKPELLKAVVLSLPSIILL